MNYKAGRFIGQLLFFLSICLLCIAVFFNLTGVIVPILVITGILVAVPARGRRFFQSRARDRRIRFPSGSRNPD